VARARGEAGFQKLVAVKRMRPALADDARFVTMFLDEGRVAANIQSPTSWPPTTSGGPRTAPSTWSWTSCGGVAPPAALRDGARGRALPPRHRGRDPGPGRAGPPRRARGHEPRWRAPGHRSSGLLAPQHPRRRAGAGADHRLRDRSRPPAADPLPGRRDEGEAQLPEPGAGPGPPRRPPHGRVHPGRRRLGDRRRPASVHGRDPRRGAAQDLGDAHPGPADAAPGLPGPAVVGDRAGADAGPGGALQHRRSLRPGPPGVPAPARQVRGRRLRPSLRGAPAGPPRVEHPRDLRELVDPRGGARRRRPTKGAAPSQRPYPRRLRPRRNPRPSRRPWCPRRPRR
jgi:hypothetical protein